MDETTAAPPSVDSSVDVTLPPLAANGYPEVPGGAALDLLDTLTVDDAPAPVAYERRRFGLGWADPDGDGCTGRQSAIVAAAVPGTVSTGARCSIESVTIESLYDGAEVVATTRVEVEHAIQVDHIVPLKDAYRTLCCVTGPFAQRLRVLFYNDPENLRAVSAAANQAKSDDLFGDHRFEYASDAAACFVADHTVRVKAAYGLPVGANEAAALRARLEQCPPQSGSP